MVSEIDRTKRALVTLIRQLAGIYSITLALNRDCSDDVLRKAYRTLSRKVHPDKGGNEDDQKKLNGAYKAWCEALSQKPAQGRPDRSGTKGS